MVSLKFHDVSSDSYIECFVGDGTNNIYLITEKHNGERLVIELDRSTAIKLSKELRKQIALLNK